VHHEFFHEGQTVNRWYYLEVLQHLRENVTRKRPQLWKNNSWFLHHDKPAHESLLIRDLCANTNTTEIHFERTAISDDSRDYGIFADGATCDPEKGVPGLFPEVAMVLEVVHQWRWEYFEGDKAHSVAGMSIKIIKKIVLKLSEQTTYTEDLTNHFHYHIYIYIYIFGKSML
jgi:hypothetical protein